MQLLNVNHLLVLIRILFLGLNLNLYILSNLAISAYCLLKSNLYLRCYQVIKKLGLDQ